MSYWSTSYTGKPTFFYKKTGKIDYTNPEKLHSRYSLHLGKEMEMAEKCQILNTKQSCKQRLCTARHKHFGIWEYLNRVHVFGEQK